MVARLVCSFCLAVACHLYLLQFHLIAYQPAPPELISDSPISVTLNQKSEQMVVKPSQVTARAEKTSQQERKPEKIKPLKHKAKNSIMSPKAPVKMPETPAMARDEDFAKHPPTPAMVNKTQLSKDTAVAAEHNSVAQPTASVVKARPHYQHNPQPEYPDMARRRGWEGTVMLLVEVTEEGRVASVTLQQSCGYEILDKSARKAVKTWQFLAGTADGRPTVSTVVIPVHFILQK